MKRRTLLVWIMLGMFMSFGFDPAQSARAASLNCGPGQGSFTLVSDYGIGVSGVAKNEFTYTQSPHSVLVRPEFDALIVASATARYDGPSWQIEFKQLADGSLWYQSRKPFIYVQLCLYPDDTGGQPQVVYPTSDAHGNSLSTNNNVVAIGNTDEQASSDVGLSSQAASPGDWPPGGETPPAASPGFRFPWHTIDFVAGWVMRLIWITSVIVGACASRRRGRDRPAP